MFDTSNRQACRVRQTPTSTPLHALTTLNDPTWIEAARKLAETCLTSATDADQQLTMAFRSVMGRSPSKSGLEILQRALQKQQIRYAADSESARQLLSVGESPRNESLPLDQHAAMSAVCLAILNLDEAVSRE